MARLTAAARRKLPASAFGIPSQRKYPMQDKGHEIAAKGRATQQVKKGNLAPSTAAHIKAKANKLLHKGHHRTSSGRHSFHNMKHPGTGRRCTEEGV